MPSPMASSPPSPSQSISRKTKSLNQLPPMRTAASCLSTVHQADTLAHCHEDSFVASSPTLSCSSATTSSWDTLTSEGGENSSIAYPHTSSTSQQVLTTLDTEFGHCTNGTYRCISKHDYTKPIKEPAVEELPYYIIVTTYLSLLLVFLFGQLRDFFGKRFMRSQFTFLMHHNGYAPLNSGFDSFFTRRMKSRADDCFFQPVTGVAGRTIVILDRYSTDYYHTFIYTGGKTRALNVSSYNYLGFAQAHGGCADAVEESVWRFGISTCGTRLEGGSSELHVTAEALVASFMGMEDALISSTGFATNSTFIPALVGKGSLVISDEMNHTSIRVGIRYSGAHVRTFKHNDMDSLEALLREVICQGQPKSHRPWKKILVIVEGLYSMEGTIVNLPRIIELKQKYKFYLFVDEAHSIGALGPHGRGVTDYFSIPPRSVDLLMGTFTKSFGATGGYIAGPKTMIDTLRLRGHSGPYAEAISPPVLAQIIASMASIMGVVPVPQPMKSTHLINPHSSTVVGKENEGHPGMAPASMLPIWMNLPLALADGSEAQMRIRRLAFNSRYLHAGLRKLGFIVYGHPCSPIVSLILSSPGKLGIFARVMRARSTPIVIVIAGYPAVPFMTSRVRFCVSAAHTKDDIDLVLRACDELGEVLDLKYGSGERWGIEEVCKRAVELVQSV